MQNYEDLDYEQFLRFDRATALQWTFLPESPIEENAAADPPTHKVVLVPTDPHYSPTEDELWPVVHQAVLDALAPHSEVRDTIQAAVRKVIDDHRGWRNPHPYTEKNINLENEPDDLLGTEGLRSRVPRVPCRDGQAHPPPTKWTTSSSALFEMPVEAHSVLRMI